MANLWSRNEVLECVRLFTQIEQYGHDDERSEALRTRAVLRVLNPIPDSIYKHVPAYLDVHNPGMVFIMLANALYPPTKGVARLNAEEWAYLLNASENGAYTMILDKLGVEYDLFTSSDIPEAIRLAKEAEDLARAFVADLLHQTPTTPPHVIGASCITKTGIPLLDDTLNPREIRLIIREQGMWFSLIFPDGGFAVAWWCPDGDLCTMSFGLKYGWVLRTFCACLWHDLHKTEAVHPKKGYTPSNQDIPPKNQTRLQKNHTDTVIRLPKKIYTLTWGTHSQQTRGKRDAYAVRSHYRKLHADNWTASETSIQNAMDAGMPKPPSGYTFISAHVRGDGDVTDTPPPRIVATGLQVAQVALSKF